MAIKTIEQSHDTNKDLLPLMKTKVPGPLGQKIIARDNKVMSTSYTRPYPFVMDHGEG